MSSRHVASRHLPRRRRPRLPPPQTDHRAGRRRAYRGARRRPSRQADHGAAAAPTTAPAAAAKPTTAPPRRQRRAQGCPALARQLLLAQGGTQGKYLDYDLWNAYALGANHQTGPNLTHEPLAFYSAYGDKEYLWLASRLRVQP